MTLKKRFPFRLGTTSYILPADLLPNVEYLAPLVEDVELVLFEVDDGPSNLPDAAELAELARLAARFDLTYTVHLPLDLRLAADNSDGHVSMVKARRVIEHTRALNPFAYVLHLDGREARDGAMDTALWERQAVRALQIVTGWVGDATRLCVENLDHYPPDFWDGVLTQAAGISRCVDVGHLWLEGHDPLPFLCSHLGRARVIHLHGVAERDHSSLGHAPPQALKAVLLYLIEQQYRGVLTIEVFSDEDLRTSLAAIQGALGME